MIWWRTAESTPTSASPYHTAGSASVKIAIISISSCHTADIQKEWTKTERLSDGAPFRTHGFPVVKGLIAVGDVAEQSCTESGREQTFECSGTFRSPNLPSTTDWAVKKNKKTTISKRCTIRNYPQQLRLCSPRTKKKSAVAKTVIIIIHYWFKKNSFLILLLTDKCKYIYAATSNL